MWFSIKILEFYGLIQNSRCFQMSHLSDLRRPYEQQNRFWSFPTISKCNSQFWLSVWFQSSRCKQQTVEYLFSILSLLGGAYQQQNLWKKRCQWLVGFKRRCLFLPHLAQLAPIIKFQVVHAHHYCKGWNYYTVWSCQSEQS